MPHRSSSSSVRIAVTQLRNAGSCAHKDTRARIVLPLARSQRQIATRLLLAVRIAATLTDFSALGTVLCML